MPRRPLVTILLVTCSPLLACSPTLHVPGHDDQSDDDAGDDDALADDDTADGCCPWSGLFFGEAEIAQKDPWGDFTLLGLDAWAEIDGDCHVAGELDLSRSTRGAPLAISGQVTALGAAEGSISGALGWIPDVDRSWTGSATDSSFEGAWQDLGPDGLPLHGSFWMDLAQ